MSCNVSFSIAGIGCVLLLVVNPIRGLFGHKDNRKLMSSCRRKDEGTSGIPQTYLIKELHVGPWNWCSVWTVEPFPSLLMIIQIGNSRQFRFGLAPRRPPKLLIGQVHVLDSGFPSLSALHTTALLTQQHVTALQQA